MHHHELIFTPGDITQLREYYYALVRELEYGEGLPGHYFSRLSRLMSRILNNQPGLENFWQLAQNHPTQSHHLHINHTDKELLNMPWQMAVDAGQFPGVCISKGLPKPAASLNYELQPGPLKILIMISSPEDSGIYSRLSYEQEEMAIFEALSPLLQSGQVQVDFTGCGSLQSLQQQLQQQYYHILYFSGHGIYKNNIGYLMLEDEQTLNSQLVTAQQFADCINQQPLNKPALVILNSCQTAKGSLQPGMHGMSDELLNIAVPAVIAMAFSVTDQYAILFAAELFQHLANKASLPQAYYFALRAMQQQEQQEINTTYVTQWLIPQLYYSGHEKHIVNWQLPFTPFIVSKNRFTKDEPILFPRPYKQYYFIGRQRESVRILNKLVKNDPVLLTGQGGIGKTAMIEHLVYRLTVNNSSYYCFAFNEATMGPDAMIITLQQYLEKQGEKGIINMLNKHMEIPDKLDVLIQLTTRHCTPVWAFDNMESCQQYASGPLKKIHAEWLAYLQNNLLYKFPVILSSRYPVSELPANIHYNLKEASFTDFYTKCHQLNLDSIRKDNPTLTYSTIAYQLYSKLGGNYRALEFFDQVYKNTPSRINGLHHQLSTLSEAVQDKLASAGKKIIFSELLQLLTREQLQTLQLLTYFYQPVEVSALVMQKKEYDYTVDLQILKNLTLVTDVHQTESRPNRYYVSPLVKDWLHMNQPSETGFSHIQAGAYYIQEFDTYLNYKSLEEAFRHYAAAGDKSILSDIGGVLSNHYFKCQLFEKSLYYGLQVAALPGGNTYIGVLNNIGIIYKFQGHYDLALTYFEKCLEIHQQSGAKEEAYEILHNMANVYADVGNTEMALQQLFQCLRIQLSLNDQPAMAQTYNSIGVIYASMQQPGKALEYYEQSLSIQKTIGDYSDGIIFSNISEQYIKQGLVDKALNCLQEGLALIRKLGNYSNEAKTLNRIAGIFQDRHELHKAYELYQESLSISQSINDDKGVAETLNNIALIYTEEGDFDKAMQYLQKAWLRLANKEPLRMKAGIAVNIGRLFSSSGEHKSALFYLEEGLLLYRKLNSQFEECQVLRYISTVYQTQHDSAKALQALEQSLTISQSMHNVEEEGLALTSLGRLYKETGDYTKAIEYLKRAKTKFTESKNEEEEANVMLSIGLLYELTNEDDNALAFFYECLSKRKTLNDQRGQAQVFHHMGVIAWKRGQLDEYFRYEQDAYHIYDKLNDIKGIYYVGRRLGAFLLDSGHPKLKETGLILLYRSHEIGVKARYPDAEKILEYIKKHSGNHTG